MCLFDASKAFDKVNHWKLFIKLIRRGVPAIIIKLLVFLAFDKVNHWKLFIKLIRRGVPAIIIKLLVFLVWSSNIMCEVGLSYISIVHCYQWSSPR